MISNYNIYKVQRRMFHETVTDYVAAADKQQALRFFWNLQRDQYRFSSLSEALTEEVRGTEGLKNLEKCIAEYGGIQTTFYIGSLTKNARI